MSEARVTSLPAAAYVLAKGAKLLRCEPSKHNPSHVDLIFEDPVDDEVTELVRDYFRGSEIPACEFYRELLNVRFEINRARTLGVGRGGEQ